MRTSRRLAVAPGLIDLRFRLQGSRNDTSCPCGFATDLRPYRREAVAGHRRGRQHYPPHRAREDFSPLGTTVQLVSLRMEGGGCVSVKKHELSDDVRIPRGTRIAPIGGTLTFSRRPDHLSRAHMKSPSVATALKFRPDVARGTAMFNQLFTPRDRRGGSALNLTSDGQRRS